MLSLIKCVYFSIAYIYEQEISREAIKVIVSKLSSSTDCYAAMTFLDAAASARPADVVPYEDDIIKAYNSNEMMIGLAGGVLLKLGDAEVDYRLFWRAYL
jgi:hypothetical protein